ncbi:hypothetical protein ACS0TY_008501 [Phlomoides rotata]
MFLENSITGFQFHRNPIILNKRPLTELLPEVIADKNDLSKTKLKQVSQLLKDPNSFRGNQIVLSTNSMSYCAAAIKVLDGLEDFPIRALSAMHRKLNGVTGYIPSMKPSKSGGRDNLICRVRKTCMKLLSGISKVDEPFRKIGWCLRSGSLNIKANDERSRCKRLQEISTRN